MKWAEEYEKHKGAEWKKTKLDPKEEEKFQAWLVQTQWFRDIKQKVGAESGGKVDTATLLDELAGDQADYDYRGAWKSGIGATSYEYDSQMHWPSRDKKGNMLKSPKHPTAWMEFFMQEHGVDPHEVGASTHEKALEWEKNGAQLPMHRKLYGRDGKGAQQ